MYFQANRNINKEIIDNISKGDSKSFELLYKALFQDLCRYANRFLEDKDHSYEIVQDVFVKLWEKRAKIVKIQSVKSYLYRSVYNAIVNYFDHEKVKQKHDSLAIHELKRIELESFEETFYGWDEYDKLHEFIEELPEKNRKVFILRYFENNKYKEIAEKLDITERTVETHIRNSLKDLRSKFKSFMENQYLF